MALTINCAFIFLLSIDFARAQSTDKAASARHLEDDLLRNYRRFMKPRVDQKEPIKVWYSSIAHQLLNVETDTQRVKLNFWMHLVWIDEFMKWNPKDYAKIKVVFIDPVKIWVPDIVIRNRQDNEPAIQKVNQILAAVNYLGQVSLMQPMAVTVQCDIDTRHFPWDKQQCDLHIESWTNFDNNILLKKDQNGFEALMKLTNITEHHEWTLNQYAPVFKQDLKYDVSDGCLKNKTYIEHRIRFRRKPNFYIFVIVIPTFVISFVSMFVFILPNASSEKITFSMSMMLTFYINLLTVANNIPNCSSYPYIGTYYLFCIFLLALSLFQTALTLNMHYKSKEVPRAPMWLRSMIAKLLTFLIDNTFLKHFLSRKFIASLLEEMRRFSFNAELNKMDDVCDLNNNQAEKTVIRILRHFDEVRTEFDKRSHKKKMILRILAEWQIIAKAVDIALGAVFFVVANTATVFVLLKSTRVID